MNAFSLPLALYLPHSSQVNYPLSDCSTYTEALFIAGGTRDGSLVGWMLFGGGGGRVGGRGEGVQVDFPSRMSE